jgi:hypothetical protein
MILGTNMIVSVSRLEPVGVCDVDAIYFVLDSKWIFKYYSEEIPVSEV